MLTTLAVDRRGSWSGGCRSRILESQKEIDDIKASWAEVAVRAHTPSLFALPEVYQSWRNILAERVSSKVVAVVHDDALVGVLPIMIGRVWRGPRLGVRYDYAAADRRYLVRRGFKPIPVRQLSPVLSLPGTMLGPSLICLPEWQAGVIAAVADGIRRIPAWDAVVIPAVEGCEAEAWCEAFRDRGLDSVIQRIDRPCKFLSPVVPFHEILTRHAQFRQNVHRARRAAMRIGLDIQLLVNDIPAMLSKIARLATLSWKEPGRAGQDVHMPYSGAQRRFFEDLFTNPDLKATRVTAVATLDGRPVAATLATAHAGTLTTLLTFWDGRAPEASPGVLLLGELIDYAHSQRLTQVDYNTGHPWIRYISDRMITLQNVVGIAPTSRGRMLSWLSAQFRGRP